MIVCLRFHLLDQMLEWWQHARKPITDPNSCSIESGIWFRDNL